MSSDGKLKDAKRYFDDKAGEYTDRSEGSLWGTFRKREADALLSLLDPQKDEKILDAGSGTGFYTQLITESGAVPSALDVSAEMIQVLAKQFPDVETMVGNFEEVALKPKFDKILIAGALEFTDHPAKAFRHLAKGLSPDGPATVVVLVPRKTLAGYLYWCFHRTHGFSVNLFGRKDIIRLGRGARFHVDAVRHTTFNAAVRFVRSAS
jgi:ubiquinone/menaquinone biosynthesis C-methylase UbiE